MAINQLVNGTTIFSNSTPDPPTLTLQFASSTAFGVITTPNVDFSTSNGVPRVRRAGVRQTVLTGDEDSSNTPIWITNPSGQILNISATTDPVCLTWANGFDSAGQLDYTGWINADVANAFTGLVTGFSITSLTRVSTVVTAVTASSHNLVTGAIVSVIGANETGYNVVEYPVIVLNSTSFTYSILTTPTTPATGVITAQVNNYHYVDLDVTTLGITFGSTLLPPIYHTNAPTSINAGQCWFDMNYMVMKLWSGSAYSQIYRLFVGDSRTSVSNIFLLRVYAYAGVFYGTYSLTSNTIYSVIHNIGSNPDFYVITGVNTAIIGTTIYKNTNVYDFYDSLRVGITSNGTSPYITVLLAGYLGPFIMRIVGDSYVTKATSTLNVVIKRGW
jgi:hypothetical protein